MTYYDKDKKFGLIMNKYLGWADHVALTSNRVFASIQSLKPLAYCVSVGIKVMLFKTLVVFHITNWAVLNIDKTAEPFSHIFFTLLSMMILNDFQKFQSILDHSILKMMSPQYLPDRFVFISARSVRDTRKGAALLSFSLYRTALYNKYLL